VIIDFVTYNKKTMKFYKRIIFLFFILLKSSVFSQTVLNWEKISIHNNTGVSNPKTICVGDIDGDGIVDVVSGDADGGICWIKNKDGNGNFGRSNFVARGSGSYGVTDIYVADMDGDGFNDIVYVNTLSYWVKNLDGNGTFGAPVLLSTTTTRTYGLQVIDIDNDDDFDVVQCRSTTSSSYVIEVLKNNGNGTFVTPTVIFSSSGFLRFKAVDISGDTLPDIVSEGSSAVVYYQQNPNGTFSFTENMGSTSNHMSSGILYMGNIEGGDIDNDGDNDIVNVYQNGAARSIKWFRNDNNVFANSQILIDIPSDNGSDSNDYFTFTLSDLDHDGKLDIILQNSFLNKVSWYKNLGNSTFGPQQIISTTVLYNNDLVIADINNDTKVDVIVPDYGYDLIKWFDNVNGNASSFVEYAIDNYVNIPFLGEVGDVDGNGTKDAIVASKNSTKLVWCSNVDGIGTYSDAPKHITTSLNSYTSIVLIDANNDGHKDIVASSGVDAINKVVWLANDGQGNFSNEQVLTTSNAHTLKAIDVDNDGDKDLIAYYSYVNSTITSSDLKVFINNGNGFDAPVIFTYPTNTFKSVEPVDMDNDGDLDLMIYLSASTTQNPKGLYWIENTNGLGNFTTLHPTNLDLVSSQYFAIADWNEDGLKDLVYTHRTQIGVRSLKSVSINTNGTLGTPVNLPITAVDYNVLKFVDLDNDGDLDILSQYTASNTYFIWYENIGNGSFTYRSIFDATVPVSTLNFLEDFNADNNTDFAFTYENSSSEVACYQNLGLNLNQIKGNVSLDVVLNGCTDGSIAAQQVLVTNIDTNSNESVSVFTGPSGNYSFKVDAGNYSTSVTTAFPYFNDTPSAIDSQFDTTTGEMNANFCLEPTQFFDDLELSFYPLGDARPGFSAKYLVVAKNKGTNAINTAVTLEYNNQKINYTSASPAPQSQTTNSMVFDITNLQPFQTYKTTVTFQVNTIPAVTIGESITFNLENNFLNDISPETNNVQYNQTILGSYDPNDMIVLEGEQVHIDNSDKYLHYIIRFQNTGNYFAERVLIATLLDEKLDLETIELEGSSHINRVEIINGSLMNFIFDAIYLPAISINEEGSKGFVAFKVKPKSTVEVNDTVTNESSIYFDYNPPITTNAVATTFVTSLSISEQKLNPIYVYPNPVNSLLFIKNIEGNYRAEIYSPIGVLISKVENNSVLDFTNLSVGIYIVKIIDEMGKIRILKVIKK
jgi:hypothetical protein